MTIRTVYVQGDSKAAINRRLANGDLFEAIEFTMGQGEVYDLERLPAGTVVKVFSKYVGGSPYAKAYGNVAYTKDGKVTIK